MTIFEGPSMTGSGPLMLYGGCPLLLILTVDKMQQNPFHYVALCGRGLGSQIRKKNQWRKTFFFMHFKKKVKIKNTIHNKTVDQIVQSFSLLVKCKEPICSTEYDRM